jgi:hypothetical protein
MTENEMTGLLLKLADIGVTGVKITYDGGGDSGCIENIGYTAKPCETPEDVNDDIDVFTPGCNLADLSQELYTQLENFAHSTILDEIEDWWNNEGGWGELCICVPSGKYIVNNNVRISDHEEFFHDGSLFEKTED